MMLEHLTTAQLLGIALSTLWAARLTRPERNYWPMLRVIWAVLGAVYMGSTVNSLLGGRGGPAVRAVFLLVTQLAILYAVWFMRKRNATARYITLTVEGQEVTLPVEEYQRLTNVVVSLLAHGTMPAAWVPQVEAALAEWHRHDEGWRVVRAKARRRWQERRGIPDVE